MWPSVSGDRFDYKKIPATSNVLYLSNLSSVFWLRTFFTFFVVTRADKSSAAISCGKCEWHFVSCSCCFASSSVLWDSILFHQPNNLICIFNYPLNPLLIRENSEQKSISALNQRSTGVMNVSVLIIIRVLQTYCVNKIICDNTQSSVQCLR